MSKTLLVYQDKDLLGYFSTLLDGLLETEVVAVESCVEALSLINKNSEYFSLIMVDFETQNSSSLINAILSFKRAIPCIITSQVESLEIARRTYKTQTLLDYFYHYDRSELLWNKILKMIELGERGSRQKKYCKVNLNFFFGSKEVFCDVYLKIGESKFIKILNRYEVIDFTDLKKLNLKKVKYLYVRERDFSFIIKKMVKGLRPLTESTNTLELVQNPALSSIFSIQLQETISETIQKIGLNEEAVEMTSIAVNSTLTLIEQNQEVYKVLNSSIKGENYASEHSFLLSFIAGAMLKETSFFSHEKSLALTLAAFFHDVAIEDPELAKIQQKEEYKFKILGIQEQEEYIEHPQNAIKYLEKIEGTPPETISIVANHHETYDGTGFPQGLDFKRISPLSAIFNLAHDLSLFIYDSGGCSDNIHDILNDLSKKYIYGNYAIALNAAKKVFTSASETVKSDKKKVS